MTKGDIYVSPDGGKTVYVQEKGGKKREVGPTEYGAISCTDTVNHPSHYTQGTLETIDAIEGLQLEYHLGNVLKYISRWKYKDGIRDLHKAAWYLNRFIEKVEGESMDVKRKDERSQCFKEWLRTRRNRGDMTPEQAYGFYREYHRDPSRYAEILAEAEKVVAET